MIAIGHAPQGVIQTWISSVAPGAISSTRTVSSVFRIKDDGTLPFALDSSIPDPGDAMALVNINCTIRDGLGRVDYLYQAGRRLSYGAEWDEKLEGSLSEEPITAHPDIGDLLDDYAAKPPLRGGMVNWLEELDFSGAKIPNPLSGIQDFYSPAAIYRVSKSYDLSSVPQLSLGDVGWIATSSLKGSLPSLQTTSSGSGRNWLYGGFSVMQTGYEYQVSQLYILSGIGGWNPDIYDKSTSAQSN